MINSNDNEKLPWRDKDRAHNYYMRDRCIYFVEVPVVHNTNKLIYQSRYQGVNECIAI